MYKVNKTLLISGDKRVTGGKGFAVYTQPVGGKARLFAVYLLSDFSDFSAFFAILIYFRGSEES